MAFVYYKSENNVYSYLAMAISSDANILQVNDWDIFPNQFPFICTLEHYDENGNCIKREIVKCVNRENNTLTIQRAFEKCVADDTANPKTLQQSPYNFVAGDSISLTLTSEFMEDIQNEIVSQANRLTTAENNIASADIRITDIENFINSL